MSTITIKDEQGKALLTSDLSGEGLGKYLKAAASLRSVIPIARMFSRPLADRDGARTLGLTLDTDLPIGTKGELSINGGANMDIGLHESGGAIFVGSDLQAPVTVPHGTSYASLTLEALLEAGLPGTRGSVGFGFEAGTALRYSYFHPFDIVGNSQTVGDAVGRMLSAAVFPADADDLARLSVGAFASLAGEGEISFRGKASLSSSTNLLATPGLPLVGSLALTHGASVDVEAAWTASGEFELRVSKPDASHVHISFYRRKGRSLTVSAKAMAGVSVAVKGKELLATLMTAISRNPEADLLALVNAGLDDEPIEAIQEAIAASIDRSLTLAAQLQASGLRDDEALFAYDIDLTGVGEHEKVAIGAALHGQLASIDEVAARPGGPIRFGASATRQLNERKTSWRINVLGILNVANFVELVREGSVTFDPVSGALTAADRISSRRIRVTSRPLESDTEKLRKVLLESLLVTAAYQASRALGSTVSLTAEQLYVEQHGRTKRRDLEDHYRTLIALGLCDEAERDAQLGAGTEFGSSTFTIRNRFDSAACDVLFLDSNGQARPMAHYEGLARQAFLALLPADDPDRAFRRLPLASDEMWPRVRELGGAIAAALPRQITQDVLKLNLVRGDVFTIMWWARAMHKAAKELVAMRTFLDQRDATTLSADKDFLHARAKLSKALAEVVVTTDSRFDDPWDVLAMDAAAARQGTLESLIVATRFAVRYADTAGAPAVVAAAPSLRAARVPLSTPSASTRRNWTAEERDMFDRHVVNLRDGKLSTDGSFISSVEQVQQIFRVSIPEYVKQQRALGRPARVMFYAHGGLVEEHEGLMPVLARRRFWELNGVYPVYFVWETGLLETLTVIARDAIPNLAARGPISDMAIERAARPGGRVVWGRMKSGAEKASASDGGAALVATLAGALWKELNGEIEFHALGHSAGAIFHAFFLPLLVGQRPPGVPPVDVRTLHLLAPALTTELFKTRLQKLTGQGQPITSLTAYTMTDELEQSDDSLRPYGKSLLYLVSQAFEDEVPSSILGLQKSLTADLQLIRFFGLAGTEKVGHITFSPSPAGTSLNARTESITHGGFDNDIATMTSVIRRVLDVPDSDTVVDYFEESIPGFERAAVETARSGRSLPSLGSVGRRKRIPR